MTNNDTIRLRVYPATKPKDIPKARHYWPEGAMVYHSLLNDDGSLRLGCALYGLGNWTYREVLVTPGDTVPDEVTDYCRTHRANVLTGCFDDLVAIPLGLTKVDGKSGGFSYELRRYGYRWGWAVVGAGLPRQLVGMANHWTEARSTPGAWSLVLAGLGEWVEEFGTRRFRKFADAPRIRLNVLGEHVLASWGSTRRNDHLDEHGDERRPANRFGPFVDVLSVGSALAGGPVRDLTHACQLFGVDLRQHWSNHIDQLRTETLAIRDVYRRQLAMVKQLDVGIDMSNLVSTGGIATALLRESGIG